MVEVVMHNTKKTWSAHINAKKTKGWDIEHSLPSLASLKGKLF